MSNPQTAAPLPTHGNRGSALFFHSFPLPYRRETRAIKPTVLRRAGAGRTKTFVCFAAALLILELLLNSQSMRGDYSVALWVLASCILLGFAGWFPVLGSVLYAAVIVIGTLTADSPGTLIFPLIGIYVVAADWLSRRWYWQTAVIVTVVNAAILSVSTTIMPDLVGIGLGTVVSTALGLAIRTMHSQIDVLQGRADDAYLRALAAEQTVRQDLAASLHDTVARDLSGIIVSSEIASEHLDDGRDATEEMARINAAARESLRRVRSLIGGMQSTDPAAPFPDVVRTCSAMLEISSVTLVADMPEEVDLRLTQRQRSVLALVVREGTANILKYAPRRSTANLMVERLAHGPATLTLVNQMPTSTELRSAYPELAGGFGLANVASRIRDERGTIDWGERGGTWILTVEIPANPDDSEEAT